MTSTFSIVVPTYRRAERLQVVLERLQSQDIAAELFEVIVTDDDAGQSAAASLCDRFPHVRFVKGPGRGPSANRNCGASHATGDWLVFTDDDCLPALGWLRALSRAASADCDVVEGRIVIPDQRDSVFRRDVENLYGGVFWSANLAVRRDVFVRMGGFDEDFGEAVAEDMELGHRFRVNGARTTFCPDAVIEHPSHVMTLSGLLESRFRLRWHTLYVIKTNPAMAADISLWQTTPRLIAMRTLDLLRTVWHAIRMRRPQRKWTAMSEAMLDTLMFPVILPHLIYWDLRFRRILRKRKAGLCASYAGGR